MRPSTIRYFLKEGFSGLKKNLLMTVASIIAVAACISIMSFSYCVVSNLQYMLDQMEDSIGISVFLKGDLTSGGRMKIFSSVWMIPITLCPTLSRWNWIRSNLRMPYWLNCRKSKALIR